MLFACFEQSAWEDYSVQEKTALLQSLADYVTSVDEGFDAYKSQPLEVSARAYAEEKVKQILKYIE